MGQTSNGFLKIFFTLVLPLLLFLNLLAFGQMFGFADAQQNGDVYVGFSSFINSISLFEGITTNFDLGFFSPSKIAELSGEFLNALLLGMPRMFSEIFTDGFLERFDLSQTWSWSSFPKPSFSFATGDNVVELFQNLVTFFNNTLDYFYEVCLWFRNSLGSWYTICYLPFAVVVSIASVILSASYVLGCLLYYGFVFIVWFYYLCNGKIVQPMPSVNNSSWSQVAEDWTNYWVSQNGLLPPLRACL